MVYFNIGRTNEISVIGNYPQTSLAITFHVDSFDSYRNVQPDIFPIFQPRYSLELNPKSKETDIIDSLGLSFGFIFSEKLKLILHEFNLPNYKFYPITVVGSKTKYYWFHYITKMEEFLDFKKTEIEIYKSRPPFEIEEIKIFRSQNDIMDFKKSLPYTKSMRFKKIQLNSNFPNYDIFEITGAQYFTLISEKLRDILIEENITGLEMVEYTKIKLAGE
jgi:hypothetical protein